MTVAGFSLPINLTLFLVPEMMECAKWKKANRVSKHPYPVAGIWTVYSPYYTLLI
jgi:hypothetical protein